MEDIYAKSNTPWVNVNKNIKQINLVFTASRNSHFMERAAWLFTFIPHDLGIFCCANAVIILLLHEWKYGLTFTFDLYKPSKLLGWFIYGLIHTPIQPWKSSIQVAILIKQRFLYLFPFWLLMFTFFSPYLFFPFHLFVNWKGYRRLFRCIVNT